MVRTVRRERRRASGTLFRSDEMMVILATSIAMSLPLPHSDAQVGLCQRGTVVDAVAHHAYGLALGLQLLDVGRLLLRQHPAR